MASLRVIAANRLETASKVTLVGGLSVPPPQLRFMGSTIDFDFPGCWSSIWRWIKVHST
jgi:hypothetical protein